MQSVREFRWWTVLTNILYGWYTSTELVQCTTCGRSFSVGVERPSQIPYCSIPCSISAEL